MESIALVSISRLVPDNRGRRAAAAWVRGAWDVPCDAARRLHHRSPALVNRLHEAEAVPVDAAAEYAHAESAAGFVRVAGRSVGSAGTELGIAVPTHAIVGDVLNRLSVPSPAGSAEPGQLLLAIFPSPTPSIRALRLPGTDAIGH